MPPEALIEGIGYSNKLDCFSFGVLCIQIMTRNFPNPGEAGGYVEDPKYPNGRVLIQYREVDRRKKDIDLIKSDHPLLPMALNCLKDKDVDRPLADELCEQLAILKSEPEYLHVMEQTENGTPQVHMEKNEDSTQMNGMQEAERKPELEGKIKVLQEKMEKTVNEYKQEMKRKADEYQQKLKQKTKELQQEHQKELEQKIEEHLKRKNVEVRRELARKESELKAKSHHEIRIIEEKHKRELDEFKKKMDAAVSIIREGLYKLGGGGEGGRVANYRVTTNIGFLSRYAGTIIIM